MFLSHTDTHTHAPHDTGTYNLVRKGWPLTIVGSTMCRPDIKSGGTQVAQYKRYSFMPFIFGLARSEPTVAFEHLYKCIPEALGAFFDVPEEELTKNNFSVSSITIDHSDAEA